MYHHQYLSAWLDFGTTIITCVGAVRVISLGQSRTKGITIHEIGETLIDLELQPFTVIALLDASGSATSNIDIVKNFFKVYLVGRVENYQGKIMCKPPRLLVSWLRHDTRSNGD